MEGVEDGMEVIDRRRIMDRMRVINGRMVRVSTGIKDGRGRACT